MRSYGILQPSRLYETNKTRFVEKKIITLVGAPDSDFLIVIIVFHGGMRAGFAATCASQSFSILIE